MKRFKNMILYFLAGYGGADIILFFLDKIK